LSEDILELSESWPGTTIDGEPGIVRGHLSVTTGPGDGSLLLNLSVGADGGGPELAQYVEFLLSPENVVRLRNALDAARG
jgi:hypothetical protein